MQARGQGVKHNGEMSDGRKDRWDAHRERRRAEFLAAGLRVLRTDGPELLMDAVAAEAGVTKPVLYRYFADKAALVEALAEHGLEMIMERVIPPILADGPAMARIRGGVGAYFAFVDEYPELYWLIIKQGNTESGGEGSAVTKLRETLATRLTAVYGDYLRAFGLDSGAAEPWGYGITGLVRSTAEWWLERRSMGRAYVTEYVSQLIWSALTGVLHEAGIRPDPNAQVPTGRPTLTLRAGERTGGPRGSR